MKKQINIISDRNINHLRDYALVTTMDNIIESGIPIVWDEDSENFGYECEYLGATDLPSGEVNLDEYELPE